VTEISAAWIYTLSEGSFEVYIFHPVYITVTNEFMYQVCWQTFVVYPVISIHKVSDFRILLSNPSNSIYMTILYFRPVSIPFRI
jgi:hypothetical protein